MSKLTIFFIFCILLLWPNPVYAYLDPGSGSMILQILLAGFAGLAVILKLFWHRFLALFGIGKKNKGDTESDHS
ncbi:MAG: hypothetical protein ACE5KZ_08430 [Candidatus Scalinduaceae bacterium]